jgi:hypothetical protein
MSPLTFTLELTIALALWLCLGAWQMERGTPGRASLVGVCLAGVAWCAGELAFLHDLLPEVTADRIKYLGVLGLPPFWVSLAATTVGLRFARKIPWFSVVLLSPQVCLYAFLFSDLLGGLMLTTVQHGPDHYGRLWWVANIYGSLLVVIGSGIFLRRALRRSGSPAWRRDLVLGLAPLAPLAANGVFVTVGRAWHHDPTPLFFAIPLVALHGLAFGNGSLRTLSFSGRRSADSPSG